MRILLIEDFEIIWISFDYIAKITKSLTDFAKLINGTSTGFTAIIDFCSMTSVSGQFLSHDKYVHESWIFVNMENKRFNQWEILYINKWHNN